MRYKKYIKLFLLINIGTLLCIGLVNWIVDPMWTFQKKSFLHQYQSDFNEGQQKVNLMYFHKPIYTTLLIGNSRTTYLNHTLIPGTTNFNLGINALDPSQYNDYIMYAKKNNTKSIKKIILTLDFESYLKNPEIIQTNILKNFRQHAESPFYRYKLLLSSDTLKFSFKNIRNVLFEKYKKRDKTYDENFIVTTYIKDKHLIENRIKIYTDHLNEKKFRKNTIYKNLLLDIKHKNPNVEFITYISPLPVPVIREYIGQTSRFQLYKSWIKDIIAVFGSVHNYMYENDITKNYQDYFNDPTHFYPRVGEYIIADIFYPKSGASKQNFGILINTANYSRSMDIIEKQFFNNQL